MSQMSWLPRGVSIQETWAVIKEFVLYNPKTGRWGCGKQLQYPRPNRWTENPSWPKTVIFSDQITQNSRHIGSLQAPSASLKPISAPDVPPWPQKKKNIDLALHQKQFGGTRHPLKQRMAHPIVKSGDLSGAG